VTTEHPSSEIIALFVDGQLVDRGAIEKHLDSCADCAAEVVIARQVRYAKLQDELPPLTAGQRLPQQQVLVEHQNQHRGVKRGGASDAVAQRKSSPAPRVGGSTLFGALAGAMGLRALADFFRGSSHAPVLGASDEASSPHPQEPAGRVPESRIASDAEHASALADVSDHTPAESEPGHPRDHVVDAEKDDLGDFLDRAHAALQSDPTNFDHLPGVEPLVDVHHESDSSQGGHTESNGSAPNVDAGATDIAHHEEDLAESQDHSVDHAEPDHQSDDSHTVDPDHHGFDGTDDER
jgi:hypothetical protein